jgi:predicted hydrocarbon binding protein
MVGTFQEALFWLSGGKYFIVEEILCIAKGDSTCTFRIDKSPLE